MKKLLVTVLALCLASAVAFAALKGTFIEETVCGDVVYGEKPEPYAAALFSDVYYEYAEAGSGNWSAEQPSEAGRYSVRAVSGTFFGNKKYR